LHIIDIAGLTPAQIDSLTAIYLEAFGFPWEMPAAKLPDFARVRAGDSMTGRALALLDADAVVGFALCDYLAASNLLHLKYLAVDPTRRSQGAGARLLQAVAAAGETIARAAGKDGCRGVLIEIEIPDSPPPGADRTLRTRRIAFYERNNALITGVPYPRPPTAPPEQPDFELMLLPGSAWTDGVLPGPLDGATRRDLGRALMVEGYGADPAAAWFAEYLERIAPRAAVCDAHGAML
jgi:GNAT superfamily N-acetyltransferase